MAATAARKIGAAAARDLRDTVTVGNLEVDRAPVTNRRYAVFVTAAGHRPPSHWPQGECPEALLDHPVTGVDFFDALAFALWTDAALPTEEQWMAAAGLKEPSSYVWGDFFDVKRCNTAKSGIKGTTPVGSYRLGAAPSGAVDLCGNVWEMTCTAFQGDSDSIVVKGGSWADLPAHARLDTQFRTRVNQGSATVGFRLVYGVPGYLPHFLDRAVVDQCIAFRKADAPHFDASGDEAEFEAIVDSLRQTAAPHIAKLLSEAQVALVGSDTGPPAPAAPGLFGRIRNAWREVLSAAFWRKIVPVVRVFLQRPRSGLFNDRFRAAWQEAQRPRRGAPLRQALAAALVALFPNRGRGLRGVFARSGQRASRALTGKDGPGPRVKVRGAPPAAPRPGSRRLRRLFVLLCVLVGTGFGFVGTRMRDRQEPTPAREAKAAPPAPAKAPEAPSAPIPAPARAGDKPPIPSTTRELSADDVQAVMRRLVGGRPQERDEAERYLIWHRAETEATVRAALERRLDPAMRAALDYVAAAIAEEKRPPGEPTVVLSPPQKGLVLVCDSLEAHEEIAMVRRTAKGAQLDVTVVLSAAGDAERLSTDYAKELGDVRFLVDAGAAARFKLDRLPAVIGIRSDGRVAGVLPGRVKRSQLAELAAKLRG